MPFALTAVLFGLIVLATHFIQGITGFGSAVLAMPFCILLTGIDTARPVLTVLALVLDVYLLVVSWRHVDWRHRQRAQPAGGGKGGGNAGGHFKEPDSHP